MDAFFLPPKPTPKREAKDRGQLGAGPSHGERRPDEALADAHDDAEAPEESLRFVEGGGDEAGKVAIVKAQERR